jgi:membrane protease YdiL (CAAX protease family)
MTVLRRPGPAAALSAYSFVMLAPALAIAAGLLPFALRFHLLAVVTALCVAFCAGAGYSLADLGLTRRGGARPWRNAALLTAVLIGLELIEARLFAPGRAAPDWPGFAPFYVFVSSPSQEIVCRAMPWLLAQRIRAGGKNYVFFSSIVFSLAHAGYGDALLLANAFVAGVAWSAAFWISRSLWPIVASHACVGMFAFWIGVA